MPKSIHVITYEKRHTKLEAKKPSVTNGNRWLFTFLLILTDRKAWKDEPNARTYSLQF